MEFGASEGVIQPLQSLWFLGRACNCNLNVEFGRVLAKKKNILNRTYLIFKASVVETHKKPRCLLYGYLTGVSRSFCNKIIFVE